MFKLNQLLNFNDIVIQCHDNPDADTLACGYALYHYLSLNNKSPRLIYGGEFPITKPNLILMINIFNIPIDYTTTLNPPDLLITIDCQYGESNVYQFFAKNIAVIDHHVCLTCTTEWFNIRPELGSCSTLLWLLLEDANYDFSLNPHISTALYYGLFTDTNSLSELYHPLDRKLCDTLIFDRNIINRLKSSNLSLHELELAGIALIRHSVNNTNHFATFKAQSCDPNILGFISDLAIQVADIHSCIVYTILPYGIKYSIRSCVKEVKANELASYIAKDIGSGGGHLDKAGGFISGDAFLKKSKYSNIDEYLLATTREYFIMHPTTQTL